MQPGFSLLLTVKFERRKINGRKKILSQKGNKIWRLRKLSTYPYCKRKRKKMCKSILEGTPNTKGLAEYHFDKKISKRVTQRWIQSIISAETLPTCLEEDRDRTKWRKAVMFLRSCRTGHRAISCEHVLSSKQRQHWPQRWFRDQQGCQCHYQPREHRSVEEICLLFGLGGVGGAPPQFQQVRLPPLRDSGERLPSRAAGVTLLPQWAHKTEHWAKEDCFQALNLIKFFLLCLGLVWNPWPLSSFQFLHFQIEISTLCLCLKLYFGSK